jgi:hypothetical protein|tara:strand:+ start:616 stop:1212 length:597 start_codon:yes stop_codon:yes gene_type:complete
MKDTNFNAKIADLKYHINGLMPKDICDLFIKFIENHEDKLLIEKSYKYNEKESFYDNYRCLNLTEEVSKHKEFKEPFELAKKYLNIVVTNYVLYIQNKICPNFNEKLISKSSNIRILKYEKGQCIKDHSDVGTIERASCTINLNEDYEGGEFRFFGGRIKEKFKTGDAIIFPAEPIWIHGTEPITNGIRYSINCFLHS